MNCIARDFSKYTCTQCIVIVGSARRKICRCSCTYIRRNIHRYWEASILLLHQNGYLLLFTVVLLTRILLLS